MSKKRIIGVLAVRDGIVVQSVGFSRHLPVGLPEIAARFLDSYDVDEIVLLDMNASREGRLIDPQMVRRVADRLFVPLAVGGGVCTVQDMRTLLNAGADKIVLNRGAIRTPNVITEGARVFGAQCLIGSIDARRTPEGYRVFIDGGCVETGLEPATVAKRLQDANIGEILINSIDRDGSKAGYDEELVLSVADAVKVPVVALGGAGHPAHFASVLRHPSVSAAAAANMLHYTEHSVATIKAALLQQGYSLKNGRPGAYETSTFLADGRLAMRDDTALAEQVFEEVPEERL